MLYLTNKGSEGIEVPSLVHGFVLSPFPGGVVPEHSDSHSSSLTFPPGSRCFSKALLCAGDTWNGLFTSLFTLVGI